MAEFLPLNKENWITCGNALRLDWLSICPPTGTGVKLLADDLFQTSLDQAEIDFDNVGGETYICGNPPYLGSTCQDKEQKADLHAVFVRRTKNWKLLDYVAGWFMKAADYGTRTNAIAAFVSTNSICQGQQVPILWPLIFKTGHEIAFAHTSFKWANLASHNAGVTVVIVGISNDAKKFRQLFSPAENGTSVFKDVANINAYLVPEAHVIVSPISSATGGRGAMDYGSKPVGSNLLLSVAEASALGLGQHDTATFLRRIYGSQEFIHGEVRHCLWIGDEHLPRALGIASIRTRIEAVRAMRSKSTKAATRAIVAQAYQFGEIRQSGRERSIIVPIHTSETREHLPVGLLPEGAIISNAAYGIYDAPLWNMALIASRLHLIWIDTVCGKLETRYRYSNTLGWNTFPVPLLTEKMKADLTRCAEDILLAREAYFPATIADLYDPQNMPDNLRHAHARNDEVVERIYIGRLFRNDTERLEKLFALYVEMTAQRAPVTAKPRNTTRTAAATGAANEYI